jgi:hypothetical protein
MAYSCAISLQVVFFSLNLAASWLCILIIMPQPAIQGHSFHCVAMIALRRVFDPVPMPCLVNSTVFFQGVVRT